MSDMTEADWDRLFEGIKKRYAEVNKSAERTRKFLEHVKNLRDWEAEGGNYPHPTPVFPETIDVAYAVCHADCGVEGLIVDGGTQECQRCGRLMFRVQTKSYSKL